MAFADIHLKYQLLKTRSNLDGHIRWLEYIASPQFVEVWKKGIQSKRYLEEQVKLARLIVEEDIYAYNTTSGSGRIKRSMDAMFVENDGGVTSLLFSDPDVAPSKGPFSSGDPSEFSYAAFFEDPKFNTFLPPKDDPYDTRRYRPFFDHMTQTQLGLARNTNLRNIRRAIKMRMPRIKAK
jgi:hypothetical protein